MALPFSGSFGVNKTKQQVQKDILTKEDLAQIQLGDTQSTTTSGQNVAGSSSSASQGTSTTGTTGAQTTTGTTNQQSTQTESLLDKGTTSGLTNLIANMFGGVGAGGPAVGRGLDYLGNFDPEKFIAASMASTDKEQADALQQVIYGITDRSGRGNSMAQILGDKSKFNAYTERAKTLADTTAAANDIVGKNTQLAAGVDATNYGNLGQLINVLKGATSQVFGTQATDTSGTQASNQQTTTATAEQNQQQQQQQTTAWQQLSEQIQQLLNSSKVQQTNETDIAKGSSMGGGLKIG